MMRRPLGTSFAVHSIIPRLRKDWSARREEGPTMRISRAFILVGVLLALGAIAPVTASAQCYSPRYGGGYFYASDYGRHHHSYPVYRHACQYQRFQSHGYYRRRFWR
jgi:hypothetical protein